MVVDSVGEGHRLERNTRWLSTVMLMVHILFGMLVIWMYGYIYLSTWLHTNALFTYICLSPFMLLQQNAPDWSAYKQNNVLFIVVESTSLRSKSQFDQVRAFFWVSDFLLYPDDERGWGDLWGFSNINLIHVGSTTMT